MGLASFKIGSQEQIAEHLDVYLPVAGHYGVEVVDPRLLQEEYVREMCSSSTYGNFRLVGLFAVQKFARGAHASFPSDRVGAVFAPSEEIMEESPIACVKVPRYYQNVDIPHPTKPGKFMPYSHQTAGHYVPASIAGMSYEDMRSAAFIPLTLAAAANAIHRLATWPFDRQAENVFKLAASTNK